MRTKSLWKLQPVTGFKRSESSDYQVQRATMKPNRQATNLNNASRLPALRALAILHEEMVQSHTGPIVDVLNSSFHLRWCISGMGGSYT